MNWEEQKKIEKILKDNIKEIPYEGTEIDIYRLKEDIYEYGKQMYNQSIDDAIKYAQVRCTTNTGSVTASVYGTVAGESFTVDDKTLLKFKK